MQARSRIKLLLLALAGYALGTLLAWNDARAHGDAAWIQANPAYVDENGTHCCGPADCERAPPSTFRESDAGIWFLNAGEPGVMPRRLVGRGLYVSKDDDWWWCRRHGRVRCIFKPTTGG